MVTHFLNLLRNISKCPGISNKFIFRIWILLSYECTFSLSVSYFAKEEVSHHQKQMFYFAQGVYDHEVIYCHGLLRMDIPLIIHFVLECRTHNFYIKRWTFYLKSCSYDKNKEITCSLVTLTLCKNLKVIYISYLSINVQQSYILVDWELSGEKPYCFFFNYTFR